MKAPRTATAATSTMYIMRYNSAPTLLSRHGRSTPSYARRQRGNCGARNKERRARSLEAYNVTVDLLVTLSPFMQNPVPANVAKAINYYQGPGWGQPLEADRGFRGRIFNNNLVDDPTIYHIGMDKSAKVQAEILKEIMALRSN
jgi:hypothetical protein